MNKKLKTPLALSFDDFQACFFFPCILLAYFIPHNPVPISGDDKAPIAPHVWENHTVSMDLITNLQSD